MKKKIMIKKTKIKSKNKNKNKIKTKTKTKTKTKLYLQKGLGNISISKSNSNSSDYLYIDIHNYRFFLINKNKTNDKVFITSMDDKNIENDFIVYRSISNTGFWRLCINEPHETYGINYIYKGKDDYVQQTFINFKLQKFINDNLDNLDIDDNLDDYSCNHYFIILNNFKVIITRVII